MNEEFNPELEAVISLYFVYEKIESLKFLSWLATSNLTFPFYRV